MKRFILEELKQEGVMPQKNSVEKMNEEIRKKGHCPKGFFGEAISIIKNNKITSLHCACYGESS